MSLKERNTEMQKINVRVPVTLLDAIDDVWEQRGYASKFGFIRDAVHPSTTLSEEVLEDLAVSRTQQEESKTIPLDDVLENHDIDAE